MKLEDRGRHIASLSVPSVGKSFELLGLQHNFDGRRDAEFRRLCVLCFFGLAESRVAILTR